VSSLWYNEAGQDSDVIRILKHTPYRQSSNDVDHNYAFLGHPAATIDGRLLIDPDYSLNCFDVYTIVTRRLIENINTLPVISYESHP
jgi:hypothetical protein